MGDPNFYMNLDLRYPEIAILLNDIDRDGSRIGQFYIPILLPSISGNRPKLSTKPAPPVSNHTTNNSSKTDNYTESNYIELIIPKHLFPFPELYLPTDQNTVIERTSYLKKGTQFIIVFVGGDITNIKIIGVIE